MDEETPTSVVEPAAAPHVAQGGHTTLESAIAAQDAAKAATPALTTEETAETSSVATPVVESSETVATTETAATTPGLAEALSKLGVTEAEFLAEIEAQAAQLEAKAQQTSIEQALAEARQEHLAQVQAGQLSQEAAERIWQAKWSEESARRELASLQTQKQALETERAQIEAEKAVDRVKAEFPDAPLETMRQMAKRGWSEADIRGFAGEVSQSVKAALGRYQASKEADTARAVTPVEGEPGRAGARTLSRSDSFETLFAQRRIQP